jgi:hypothetical protein
MSCERSLELRKILGHHKPVALAPVGELALQVQKIGTGNLRFAEGGETRQWDVGLIDAGWRRIIIGSAVIDVQIWLAKKRSERHRRYDGVWVAHGKLPRAPSRWPGSYLCAMAVSGTNVKCGAALPLSAHRGGTGSQQCKGRTARLTHLRHRG